ncbi:hypothetical protein HQ545_07905 [Candidatus Woesearchaeota archaeon]|nr:hypothetical protein [Candidatus Woesearchaeota archaeon]
MFSKKGISPLIAAVLLIVIVVTIGAVVLAMVRHYISEGESDVVVGSEAIKCGRDVGISFVMVNDNYQICNSTHEDEDLGALYFIVENTGAVDILDLQVRALGTDGILQNDSVLNDTLMMGGTTEVNITYDPEDVGKFRQVKLVPRINLPGIQEHAFCSDAGITVSYVPNNCTTYQ